MRHSHTIRVWGQGTGVRGDKGLSYHMRHSHRFRVYWGDRGQGLGGTGVRVYGGTGDRGQLSYQMRHSHTFRVYWGDRGQGLGGTGDRG